MPRRVILRTPEEKADQVLSWSRPDEEFFASGACHVLVAAFLITHPAAGFAAWVLSPTTGTRGSHMIALRGDVVFDWLGYGGHSVFLREYEEAMRSAFPDWSADLRPVPGDPIGWDFCRTAGWRHPSQFSQDPLPRALAYVKRFPAPLEIGNGVR